MEPPGRVLAVLTGSRRKTAFRETSRPKRQKQAGFVALRLAAGWLTAELSARQQSGLGQCHHMGQISHQARAPLTILIPTVGIVCVLVVAVVMRARITEPLPVALVAAAVAITGFAIALIAKWWGTERVPERDLNAELAAAYLRTASQRPTAAAEDTGSPAASANIETQLVRFAQELNAALTSDRLRVAITRHLPALLGVEHTWIVTRLGDRQQVIVPDRPDGSRGPALFEADRREWTTFQLKVQRETIGILGIDVSAGGLTPSTRRMIALVAPLIAQALKTSHLVDGLRETSLVDSLTGCATRQEGVQRLRSELKRAQRGGRQVALLMLDLDHFKSINDRFGHALGDAVLSLVGRTMMQSLRASDIRCRWGGEEFLLVLPETDLAQAKVVADGVLRRIAAASVQSAVGPVSTTVSIGLTITRPGETDAEALVRRADVALYRAKRDGRGCIRVLLGDLRGEPIGGALKPLDSIESTCDAAEQSTTLPFPDRRNPDRSDRRRVPGPGRRRTDAPGSDRSATTEGGRSAVGDLRVVPKSH
jgi:diguanylate cyclase (GGDEF)-like protein